MTKVIVLPTLITEQEAQKRFAQLLEDKELRRARQAGEIGYYKRKGTISYREDELLDFIAQRLEESYTPPCHKKNSGSDDTGSTKSTDPETGTDSGMMPELKKSAADLLRQQTSKAQKSNSRRSYSKRGKAGRKTPETSPC